MLLEHKLIRLVLAGSILFSGCSAVKSSKEQNILVDGRTILSVLVIPEKDSAVGSCADPKSEWVGPYTQISNPEMNIDVNPNFFFHSGELQVGSGGRSWINDWNAVEVSFSNQTKETITICWTEGRAGLFVKSNQ